MVSRWPLLLWLPLLRAARQTTDAKHGTGRAMRGTTLLLDSQGSRSECAEYLRANGLLVYEAARLEDALEQVDRIDPDVLVVGPTTGASAIRELRTRVDHATSIIVIADVDDCEQARDAGADSVVVPSALPSEILYEVRRALILRRSGRRLPWSRPCLHRPTASR
jgi:DNA-binding response OmpR family regulator